jgi:nucleoside-diphosphate-sugar epimerase
MSVVLVTGAAGFAGGHLLQHTAGSADLVGWARSEPPPELAPFARWQRVDLSDRELVRSAVADLRPDMVYHCAGVTHVGQSFGDTAAPHAGNVIATHVLLDALRRVGRPCRVLIPGSATVYAPSNDPIDEGCALQPTSPYALSASSPRRSWRCVPSERTASTSS